ncbi:MAG: hypothetical protein J5666_02465, partial [Bacilli bacterium]|nr:hypothetical protein [Bacilli bacterium]
RVFEDMACTMSQRKSDDGYVYLTFNIESDINYYPDFSFKLMHGKYFIDEGSLGSNYDETIGTSSKVLTIKFRAGDMVSGDEYTIVIECQKRKYRDEEAEENEMVYMRYTQTFTLN